MEFNELLSDDLNFVLGRCPKDVRALLQEDYAVGHLYLAGGFIRATIAGERVNDIDLFGPTREKLREVAMQFALARHGRLHETDNAYTVLSPPRRPVQFIHRWTFGTPEALCESFDFTIAQAVVWWDGARWHSICSPRFYPDLAARRLYYTAPEREEAAGGSFLRMRKFVGAGYSIQAFSLGKLVARLASKVGRSGLASEGEEGLARVFTGLLREVDPLTVVDGVDLVDEHQVVLANFGEIPEAAKAAGQAG